GMVRAALPDASATVAATSRRNQSEPAALLGCLADAFSIGADVAWSDLTAGGEVVDLPTYASEPTTGAPTAPASPCAAAAIAMARQGGAGVLHRNLPAEDQA